LENKLADINKDGYPGSFVFDAIQTPSGTEKDLQNRLGSPEIQKSLVKRALDYATSKLSDEDMENTNGTSKSLWDNYCSYEWIRWLSFVNCGNESSTSGEDSEELVEIINEETGMCYKRKISDD